MVCFVPFDPCQKEVFDISRLLWKIMPAVCDGTSVGQRSFCVLRTKRTLWMRRITAKVLLVVIYIPKDFLWFSIKLSFTFEYWPSLDSLLSCWDAMTHVLLRVQTAFMLIAPDKHFPWYIISPSSHLLSFSSSRLLFLRTWTPLAWLYWWNQRSCRAEHSAGRFLFSTRRQKAREMRTRKRGQESDKGHVGPAQGSSLSLFPIFNRSIDETQNVSSGSLSI